MILNMNVSLNVANIKGTRDIIYIFQCVSQRVVLSSLSQEIGLHGYENIRRYVSLTLGLVLT